MNEATRLLLGCLRSEEEAAKLKRLQEYITRDWEEVLQIARQYGLAPLLFQTLKALDAELDIDGALWERLRSLYYASAARNMRLYHELLNILAALNSKGIAVIILKGAHLAESVYSNIALRPMGDVDLLAKNEDLSRVHQVLSAKGYYGSRDVSISNQLHLAPYNKKNGLNIEIHFSITKPPVSERFDIASLWERAKNDSFQGVEVLTLSPEDLILHLTAHTSIQHVFSNGLIPYFDLLHTVECYQDELNWELLWERANQWGMERSVYLMLALTEKMLGLLIPEEIKEKMTLDDDLLKSIDFVEVLIFDRDTRTSSSVARMFGKYSWRTKLKFFLGRTFPPKERISFAFRESGKKKKNLRLFWFYLLRVLTLIKKHGKTIWSGLRKDPQTRTAFDASLDIETRKNNLRDWLTNVDGIH